MARLHPKPFPGNWEPSSTESYAEYTKRTDALFKAIEAKFDLLQFPVADGCAVYAVVKNQPLTLRHVPIGDAYHVDAALIRGLTKADVARRVAADRALRALFPATVRP